MNQDLKEKLIMYAYLGVLVFLGIGLPLWMAMEANRGPGPGAECAKKGGVLVRANGPGVVCVQPAVKP